MILEDFEENISECKFLLSKFGAGAKSDGQRMRVWHPAQTNQDFKARCDLGAYKTHSAALLCCARSSRQRGGQGRYTAD